MHTDDDGHHDRAVAAVATGDLGAAADAYTRGARAVLAAPRPDVDPLDADPKGWVGDGVRLLECAAIAYHAAGATDRRDARVLEARGVCADLQQTLTAPGQRACVTEAIADLQRIGADAAAAEATATAAIDAYADAADAIDDVQVVATTPLFTAVAAPIAQLARGQDDGEIVLGYDALHGPDHTDVAGFLAHRVRTKQARWPGLLATAAETRSLAAPRGTTAYSVQTHRCPACGSRDINWVAGLELCLRCSTPLERQ